jgi:hypothetical protein
MLPNRIEAPGLQRTTWPGPGDSGDSQQEHHLRNAPEDESLDIADDLVQTVYAITTSASSATSPHAPIPTKGPRPAPQRCCRALSSEARRIGPWVSQPGPLSCH